MNKKELRMYFLVPYNILDIQKGIQSGHAALRHARNYYCVDPRVWEFVDFHETWVILNGGTTNNSKSYPGTLQKTLKQMTDYNDYVGEDGDKINISTFYETDLNNTLTAICIIAEENVFLYDKYVDFKDYLFSKKSVFGREASDRRLSYDMLKIKFPKIFEEWTYEIMDGEQNVILREILKGKKLA